MSARDMPSNRLRRPSTARRVSSDGRKFNANPSDQSNLQGAPLLNRALTNTSTRLVCVHNDTVFNGLLLPESVPDTTHQSSKVREFIGSSCFGVWPASLLATCCMTDLA